MCKGGFPWPRTEAPRRKPRSRKRRSKRARARRSPRSACPSAFPSQKSGVDMRTEWVAKRQNDSIRTQLHYARKGVVTEEMQFIAKRESLSSELVRSEVARGRM